MKWTIQTALLSCTDKTELRTLAEKLIQHGVHLISTGGTGAMLRTWGIPFQEISDYTGHPEAFNGRMKTISFNCASALLFRRLDPADTLEAAQLSIRPIDLVVCNLYAFEEAARNNQDDKTLVENIDIGGPLMVRAAAKNFETVTVLTDPRQYQEFIQDFEGATTLEQRQHLALVAFKTIAAYDVAIANELASRWTENKAPQFLDLSRGKSLRYGENPHQVATMYETNFAHSLARAQVWQGKELSYNNMLDADAAWKVVSDVATLKGVACAVIKHGNPCGLSLANDALSALKQAWTGDPVSAFGGVIAVSDVVDDQFAAFFQDKFVEIIIATGFSEQARDILSAKKNLRLLELPLKPLEAKETVIRSFLGGVLVQEEDESFTSEYQPVTHIGWHEKDNRLAAFGVMAVKHLKSNAIALVRESQGVLELAGAGMGQPNRIDSLMKLALPRLLEKELATSDVIMVSDAFFPFGDTIEIAANAGIKRIVQPGGSMRDEEVIETANRHGVAMVFTHQRHFRH